MAPEPPAQKNLIWIIDDDGGILEVTQIVLKEEGYETITIQNEDELDVQIHTKLAPKVILLDILMSGIDGRDIARKLKTVDMTRRIPIIMMSADTKLEEKVKEVQVDDYIKKPFDIDDLIKKVKIYTKKAAL